ncbi:MAG TPA: ADP-glyceromanno-heptose 6-epimerase [Methylocella sp.]|nr:ADP-glyceromanno-heptose 6-epimerase [Methylocella sp.]
MILVTGGAGFIGSILVAALEARGERIVVCDRFGTDDKWRNLAKRDLANIVVPEQIFDYLACDKDNIEVIFHLGAISSTTETDADLIVDTNFRLSCSLWRWCRDHAKRLIYASSAATYGDGTNGFKDNDSVAALAHLRPLNAYGWSKHLFDRWVQRQKEDKAAMPPQVAGLKFFNVYGPNEYHKGGQRSVAEQIYPFAARGEAFPLFKSCRKDYADGGQMRDFVWVGDCVAIMLWLLDHPGVSGLFNVGSGKARSFADLAKAVYVAAGTEPKITFRDMPEAMRDRYQYFTEADLGKLRSAGYTASMTSLEDGVAQYVRYLAAEDRYM